MANRIRRIARYAKVDDPTLAEVGINVYVANMGTGTEVRGHMTGPRCAYATTVEVAYPLRQQPEDESFVTLVGSKAKLEPSIFADVLIPEPSLWEPETPFLYESKVELWDDGRSCDRVTFPLGLYEATFRANGLLLNGRPFALRGVARDRFAPEDLPGLRRAGFNTLFTFPDSDNAALWEAADRLGFFILSRILGRERLPCARRLSHHPCALGWVLAAGMEDPFRMAIRTQLMETECSGDIQLGLEVSEKPSTRLPFVRFLVCDEPLLADLGSIPLAKLVLLNRTSFEETESQELLARPGVCGWILDPFL